MVQKIRSKTAALTMTAVIAATLLAGCGSNNDKASESPKASDSSSPSASASASTEPKKDVTITFASSQGWVNKGSKIDSELIDAFTAETGIHVDLQLMPDDQYANVLKTKLASGEVPDIFMVGAGAGAQKFFPEKYFADLSNEPWVSRYANYAKIGTTINGKINGFMTWNVDGWGVLYNTAIFEKYNLAVPKTFDELTKVSDTLIANGVKTPIFMLGKEAWYWAIWLSQFGPAAEKAHPGLYDKLNKNEAKFADIPEFETFLTQFKQMYDKGYFGKNSLSNAWDSGYEAMGKEQAGMILMYQSYQSEVTAKYPESKADQWKMFPIPLAGNDMYSHSAGGNMRVAYKDSPNLDSVKKFFDFLAKADNLNKFYAGRPDLQGNPSFTDVAGKPSEAGKSIVANSPGGEGIDLEYGVTFWDNTAVGKYIQEMMLGGKTPKQVLEAIDKDRGRLFAAVNQ
ncbi:ABC transporter substrate-binding protein [Cohnella soli]|uniref:ABC transporter substrate-binding protein n=1 Tax=Cohnella soli TaxID=425005 RepID=A0ABW0HWA2_9BACL